METKNKIYLIVSFFAAIMVLLGYFFIFPLLSDIKEASSRLSREISEAAGKKEKTGLFSAFARDFPLYELNLRKIDGLFIDNKKPVNFIQSIEKLSAETGIESKISLPPAAGKQEAGPWPHITFKIEQSGDYKKINEFLKELENRPYLFKIQDFSIKAELKAGAKTAPATYGASYAINVFTKK